MSLALAPTVDPATLTAIGYARISSDDRNLGLGVERQTEDILKVVADEGWRLAHEVVTDNDYSASKYATKKRPGFPRVMEMLRTGKVDRLVVYNLDRLLRIPRELEDLIDLVEALPNLVVVTLNGVLNLRTREGQMFARVQVAFAANEAQATHDRLLRHYDQLAAMGLPKGTGRARAFGYEKDGMTIREAEADVLAAAVNDVLNGASLGDIVRQWNAVPVVPPQGAKAWTSSSVKGLLTNPRHAGYRVHRGEVVGQAAWPAIIDEAAHRAVVAKLNDPSRAQGPRGARRPLAGLLRSVEGRALEMGSSEGRKRYGTRGHYSGERVLSVSIGADFVEGRVLDLFFEAVDSGELTRRLAERRKARPVVLAEDPAAIERELETLATMKGKGDLTFGEWQAARAPLMARLKAAQKAAEVDSATLADRPLDDLVDLRERWESFSPDRQGAYLRAAFEQIVIHRAEKPGRAAANDTSRIEPIWRV